MSTEIGANVPIEKWATFKLALAINPPLKGHLFVPFR